VKELGAVLAAFSEATQCGAVVWTQPSTGGSLTAEVGTPPGDAPAIMELIPAGGSPVEVHTPNGGMLVALLPGPRRAWLALGPCANRVAPSSGWLKFLLPVVTHYLQASLEVEHAANELAERYEEINLLYTTSEILGRTVSLNEAAKTILHEISETVGARRASILVYDSATHMLSVVAAMGVAASATAPAIEVSDECSVSASVFRSRRSMIAEDGEMLCDQEQLYRRGAMLSVPIMWTGPEGSQPLGVVNLSDRRSGQPFSAGDQKLVEAIATQIGTAIQNARLVSASIDQQRLVYEMSLAHDLQMKLLPATSIVAPEAEVAARVLPAESVGGDFYHLFRLGARRTGVMIGDVSSHGYRAALIMALAMSASAIHAQTTFDAAETLSALQASLRDELESTEMFITVFYGVIDPTAGVLRYANTGHPHAFIISADGTVSRLPALDPPLGMTTGKPDGAARPWRRGSDLLLLFTDGVTDARNSDGVRLGEQPVLEIVSRYRHEPTAAILEHVFDALQTHIGDSSRPDDLALVIVRN
jgi:sigma-B regulation protein RsbU (phosphoserine phosphatase)